MFDSNIYMKESSFVTLKVSELKEIANLKVHKLILALDNQEELKYEIDKGILTIYNTTIINAEFKKDDIKEGTYQEIKQKKEGFHI